MVLINREMLKKNKKRVVRVIDRGQLMVPRMNERGQKSKGLG